MWQSLPFPHMAYWPGHHNGKWGIVLLWYPQENSPVEKVRTQARSMHLGIALLLSVRDSERSHYSYYKHKSNFKKTMHIITKTRHELLGGKKKKQRCAFRHSISGWILCYRGLGRGHAKCLQASKTKQDASIAELPINQKDIISGYRPSLLKEKTLWKQHWKSNIKLHFLFPYTLP